MGGVCARVKCCRENQAVIPVELYFACFLLRCPLCPGAFLALQVLLWQGHPGSAFERYYNWKNSSLCVKPSMHQQFMRCERSKHVDQMTLCDFLVEMNRHHSFKGRI